jgi:hypothetical protein
MRRRALALLSAFFVGFTTLPAHAQDIDIILSNSTLIGAPGTTLTFDATHASPVQAEA